MKVYRCSLDDGSNGKLASHADKDLANFLGSIEADLTDWDERSKDKFIIEVIDMPKEEYESLDEFMGW